MTKAQARKKANQLKAIEDGLTTLIAMADKAEEMSLIKALRMAQLDTQKSRLAYESYFDVEASVAVIPFKPKGRR